MSSAQVDEPRLADVRRDELARRLDRGQEERKVARRRRPEAELVAEDMAAGTGVSDLRTRNEDPDPRTG